MSYTYHGTNQIIALPGRSVQAFPSGLVRIDRKYAVRTQDLEKFLPLFDQNSPLPYENSSSFFGTYIFPFPNIESREDGYSIISASGYNYSPKNQPPKRSVQVYNISKNYSQTEGEGENAIQYEWTIFEQWAVENFTWSAVILASQSALFYSPETGLIFELKNRRISGNRPASGANQISIRWIFSQKNISRRNFGFYDEIESTAGPEPIF